MRVAVLLLVAACGNDAAKVDAPVPKDAPKVDAPKPDAKIFLDAAIDAPPPTVLAVDCATAVVSANVTTGNMVYAPEATTIQVGQIVKFTMPSEHDVFPSGAMIDSGLKVDFGATACLKFTAPGTFGFMCLAHGFTGTVTAN
jgi:plastocyanin